MITIGIYGVSTQSGKAFMADLIRSHENVRVYGYARPSEHGSADVAAMREQGGIWWEQMEDATHTKRIFIPLGNSEVGHDLETLVNRSDLILFTHPSVYHQETVQLMSELLLQRKRPVPLILSPSRTMASPYLWQILGDGYPIISFQTCPYASKSFRPGSVFVKQIKRICFASIEGRVAPRSVELLQQLFPQFLFNTCPATSSLGNLGAIFHPTPYLMNLPAIREAAAEGVPYSFYMQGIAYNPKVATVVEEIDQIRLRIAQAIGCPVFGLRENPREEEWTAIRSRINRLEKIKDAATPFAQRLLVKYMRPIADSVVSAQHWLSYTYNVTRIPGQSLAEAIGRTPNYQERSYPQARYAFEDVPMGLVPLESLAERLGIDATPISQTIDLFNQEYQQDIRQTGRNLRGFSLDYLRSYLLHGNVQGVEKKCLKLAS